MSSDVSSMIQLVADTFTGIYSISYYKTIILTLIALSIVYISVSVILKLRVGVLNEKII